MGTENSFSDWYRACYPSVFASVAVLCPGDLSRAEEATGDAFLKALERWSRVSRMESPAGWTVRVAVNLAKKRYRRAVVKCDYENHVVIEASEPLSVELIEIREMLEGLTERQKIAVFLKYVEGKTKSDIADQLDVADGTVAATLN